MRQSRPDSGRGFQVKLLKTFQVVPSSLGGYLGEVRDFTLGAMQQLGRVLPRTQGVRHTLFCVSGLQGYLAKKKQRPPRTLQ